MAKRLGTGVSAVPPELLATAAKSLAALRQAPLQLMEATEQARTGGPGKNGDDPVTVGWCDSFFLGGESGWWKEEHDVC